MFVLDNKNFKFLNFRHTFSRRIVAGLVFSCFGDAFIIWPNLFLGGMGMFAIAQIMYISAFGFKPLNSTLGAIIFALCTIGSFFFLLTIAWAIRQFFSTDSLFFFYSVTYILMPGLNGVLAIGVPIYIMLLGTMAWRAISRVQFFKVSQNNMPQYHPHWKQKKLYFT